MSDYGFDKNDFLKGETMLNIKDVAERYKVSEDTIRKHIGHGFAKPRVSEGIYFWDIEGLVEWEKNNREYLKTMNLYDQDNDRSIAEADGDDGEWTNELTPEKLKELDAKEELAGLRWFWKEICELFDMPEKTNFAEVAAAIKFQKDYLLIAQNPQMAVLLSFATEKEKSRFIRIWNGETFAEIAAEDGISPQAVRQSFDAIKGKARKAVENFDFAFDVLLGKLPE